MDPVDPHPQFYFAFFYVEKCPKKNGYRVNALKRNKIFLNILINLIENRSYLVMARLNK